VDWPNPSLASRKRSGPLASLVMEEGVGPNLNNALYLAEASNLAYMNESTGREAFKNELGLDARLFSVGNTQAYLGVNDDHIVIVFRGTESPTSIEGLKDWLLTDANNFLILPEGRIGTDFAAAGVGTRYHSGFMTALADIWDPLFEAAQTEIKSKDRPLWLTGHSLGGALALLAAWRFLRRTVDVYRIYTFGGPMVGNDAAVKAFDQELEGKVYRFVHGPDIVPRLPTISLIANSYSHCLKEIPLGAAEAAAAASNFLSDLAPGASELLDRVRIDKIWSRLMQGISAHDLAGYLAEIQARMKQNG
jgi:triacylglycerol lipase